MILVDVDVIVDVDGDGDVDERPRYVLLVANDDTQAIREAALNSLRLARDQVRFFVQTEPSRRSRTRTGATTGGLLAAYRIADS